MGLYVYGYTDFSTSETELFHSSEDVFTNETLFSTVITDVLDKEKYIFKERPSEKGGNGYRLVFGEKSAKLYKEIISKGYIYNSKKEKLCYSFFFKEIKEDKPLKVKSTNIDIVTLPKLNFLEELKTKLHQKPDTTSDFINIPMFKYSDDEKTEFQLELEKEINMRKLRCQKREKKMLKKRRRVLN